MSRPTVFVETSNPVPCKECANFDRLMGCIDQQAKCGSTYHNSGRKRKDGKVGVFKFATSREALFIGGTHDGELIIADLAIVHLRLKVDPVYTTSQELAKPTCEIEEYHRIDGVVNFYAVSTLSPVQAMQTLINGYKKGVT